MKKLIITSFCLSVVFFAKAQTTLVSQAAVGKTTSTEDPHNPLVNGKPYSQYKAEQEALKNEQNKQQSKQPIVTPALPTLPTASKTTAPEADANMDKTIVQSHKLVVSGTNAVVTTAPVQKVKTAETGDGQVKAIDPSQTKAEPVTQKSDVVAVPLQLPAGLKLETGTGVEKVTPVEQKTVPGNTDAQAKTKSN